MDGLTRLSYGVHFLRRLRQFDGQLGELLKGALKFAHREERVRDERTDFSLGARVVMKLTSNHGWGWPLVQLLEELALKTLKRVRKITFEPERRSANDRILRRSDPPLL
jgi:hypothetical protein